MAKSALRPPTLRYKQGETVAAFTLRSRIRYADYRDAKCMQMCTTYKGSKRNRQLLRAWWGLPASEMVESTSEVM